MSILVLDVGLHALSL